MAYQFPPDPDTPCVFCIPELQPDQLFETESLYVIPDKYPLVPGHTLIISKSHIRCFGMATDAQLAELEETAAYVRRFLEEAYGTPILALENGIAGQTVFHAHFHLIPIPVAPLDEQIERHEHVTPIESLKQLKDYLVLRGHYRYLELHGRRYLLAGYSPLMRELRRIVSEATGLVFGPSGWEKWTTPDDVYAVGRHWAAWAQDAADTRRA